MGGPCYRCLFPSPPPPESVGNCSDSGVLGPGRTTTQIKKVIKGVAKAIHHSAKKMFLI